MRKKIGIGIIISFSLVATLLFASQTFARNINISNNDTTIESQQSYEDIIDRLTEEYNLESLGVEIKLNTSSTLARTSIKSPEQFENSLREALEKQKIAIETYEMRTGKSFDDWSEDTAIESEPISKGS